MAARYRQDPFANFFGGPWGFYQDDDQDPDHYQNEDPVWNPFFADSRIRRNNHPQKTRRQQSQPQQPQIRQNQTSQTPPTTEQQQSRSIPSRDPVAMRKMRQTQRRNLRNQKQRTEVAEPSVEQLSEAATKIQAAWRMYEIKKQNLIPTLKKIHQIKADVQRTVQIHQSRLSNPKLKGERLRLTFAGFEEELTRALISLDGISVKNSEFLREQRKQLVKLINQQLGEIDRMKPSILARVAQDKLEQQKEQQRKEELENKYLQQQKEYEEQKARLKQEEDQLALEKSRLDQALQDWQLKFDRLQANQQQLTPPSPSTSDCEDVTSSEDEEIS